MSGLNASGARGGFVFGEKILDQELAEIGQGKIVLRGD
jgi:hypothetical protein